MKSAIVIKTSGEIVEVDLKASDELEALQSAVGGWIEAVDLAENLTMWVNEEGKINGLELNSIATALFDKYFENNFDVIVGDIVLTGGTDSKGNTLGLTADQRREFGFVA
jgi:hypothetical protein